MTEPTARACVEVSASAERVYALVSDLPGMASAAEEFTGGTWLDGASGAAVGARFRGSNRRGWRRWSTTSTVTDAAPNRFAFEVKSFGLPVSRWQYDIEPGAGGCTLTESTWDRRPSWYLPITVLGTGVRDRVAQNQRNIEVTLERLKAAAES
ncbi:SRPBCC family protein [Actinokineospora spheciospongiae]|uniref:SRPBCC family protein n=1 Tax=Actinokineospora spheciospongiae TaxID=909613 RepID=UPI000D712EC8|nr:SRPBCC family protein [Actinokineospora spheciospongiae]PWW61832.1 polyketide cyclase/dehydrase/lipid transport protein [Actinokineospora spheciospongiae]